MGNVRHTPVLTGTPGDGGLTPSTARTAIGAGTLPATGSAERYGTNVAGGLTAEYGSAIVADALPGSVVGTWSAVAVTVGADADQGSVERVNRLVSALGAPSIRVETYWRTRALTVRVPGVGNGRVPTPCIVVWTAGDGWSIDTAGTLALRAASPAPVSAPTPRKAPVITAANVNAIFPVPAPRAVTVKAPRAPRAVKAPVSAPTTPVSAPAEPVSAPAAEPVPTPVPSAPALVNAPALFRAPGTLRSPFKVHHEPDIERALTRAVKRHAAGKRTVVLLTGPTGVGKSLTAKAVAHREGLPFLQLDAAGMSTFADWAGAVSLDESASGIVTRYAPSQLIDAVRADGAYAGIRRMVLIDEATRAAHGGALNALLTLTDGNGYLYVADARISIPIDPAVMWVLTANVGSQYSGAGTIDAALRNRVTTNLEVGYPTAAAEAAMLTEQGGCSRAVADALVKVAAQVRAISASGKISAPGVSTRQLISAAEDVAFGATPLEAALTGFVTAYDGEGGTASERNVVLVAATAILTGLTA